MASKKHWRERYSRGEKPCKRCGRRLRYRVGNECVRCKRGRNAQWLVDNRERRRDYSARYRAENREQIAERKAQRYAEDRDSIRERQAQYRAENRDKIREQQAQYRAANREKISEYGAQHYINNREKNRVRHMWRGARHRAAKQDLPFTITEDDIEIPLFCPVTGFVLEMAVGKAHPSSPSLDRIVPELGYVPGNIAVISNHANMLKRDETDPEVFRKIAQYLEQHQGKAA